MGILIKNGEIITASDRYVADVYTDGGKIVAIGQGLVKAKASDQVIDASGQIDVLGHPTGRLIGKRAAYDIDLEAVVAAAARTGVALECNAYPDRLDLDDGGCRLARERGAFIVIDTDSHASTHLVGLSGGVRVARRGGLERKHILNTRPVDELLAHRRARRGA